jgi:hypothetical protein
MWGEMEGGPSVRILHASGGEHDLVLEPLVPRHEPFAWDPRAILKPIEEVVLDE